MKKNFIITFLLFSSLEIASVLGASTKRDGFYEGNGYEGVSCFF